VEKYLEKKMEVKKEKENQKGIGMASLICGVLGLVFLFPLLSLAAIILGILGKRKRYAETGFILRVVGFIVGIITNLLFPVTLKEFFKEILEAIPW